MLYPPDDEIAMQNVKRIVNDIYPRSIRQLTKHWKAARVKVSWSGINVPTCIIAGPHDNMTPLKETLTVFNSLQRAHLYLVTAKSHMLLEANEWILDEIYEHFTRNPKEFVKPGHHIQRIS